MCGCGPPGLCGGEPAAAGCPHQVAGPADHLPLVVCARGVRHGGGGGAAARHPPARHAARAAAAGAPVGGGGGGGGCWGCGQLCPRFPAVDACLAGES